MNDTTSPPPAVATENAPREIGDSPDLYKKLRDDERDASRRVDADAAILFEAFTVTAESVDQAGQPIRLLQRVADDEGVTGVVIAIQESNVVMQVEHGFGEHAADHLMATTVDAVRVLTAIDSPAAYLTFRNKLRFRARAARADQKTRDAEQAQRKIAEIAAEQKYPLAPGSRIHFMSENLDGTVFLVDTDEDVIVMRNDATDDMTAGFWVITRGDFAILDEAPVSVQDLRKQFAEFAPFITNAFEMDDFRGLLNVRRLEPDGSEEAATLDSTVKMLPLITEAMSHLDAAHHLISHPLASSHNPGWHWADACAVEWFIAFAENAKSSLGDLLNAASSFRAVELGAPALDKMLGVTSDSESLANEKRDRAMALAEELAEKVAGLSEKLADLSDAVDELSDDKNDDQITFAEGFKEKIADASAEANADLIDSTTRRSLRDFHQTQILVKRGSRLPNAWEKLQNMIDNWRSLGGVGADDMQAELDEARALVKDAYEEKIAALPFVTIGSRVFDYENNKTGIVVLVQADFDRAIILVDGDDYHGNVYLDSVDFEQLVVSKTPPLPRDEIVKIVARYMPGMTLPADVPAVKSSADPQTTPALGEPGDTTDYGEPPPFVEDVWIVDDDGAADPPPPVRTNEIADGSYVYCQQSKRVAYVLFGDGDRVVVRGAGIENFIDVWPRDFTTTLTDLTRVDANTIALELEKLVQHVNVGDPVANTPGNAPGRIVLALNSTAIVFWSGTILMKPRFEAQSIETFKRPPFRPYSLAEVNQIIRCHRQMDIAGLASDRRSA